MAETPKWLDAAEIKRNLRAETVLAHFGALEQLTRRGEVLTGLSPFREETTPSFSVRLDRNIWNDHGGRPVVDGEEVKGNVIGLTQAFLSSGGGAASFREALVKCDELLGGTGSSLPERGSSPPRHPVSEGVRERVGESVPEAVGTAPGKHQVPEHNEAFGRELKGLRYDAPLIQERGLSPERAKYYGVGYCSRGMMKGRLVFPIRSRTGEIMAYAGRLLKDDDPNEPKWRFPNGFHKSLELYGVEHLANDAETQKAVQRHGLIVVEGTFDCLWLREQGFKNVVSTLGSDASERQQEMLVDPELNPTKRVTIFYDNDDPGRKGRKKLCGDLIHEAWVRYVDFSGVEAGERTDPDEFDGDELRVLLA